VRKGRKELIVVGDRVLVTLDDEELRTPVGLLLPPSALEKDAVQCGRIVAIGPGIPLAPPAEESPEPWKSVPPEPRYLPLQARIGDYAVFFRKAAIEVSFEGSKYVVVPQSALLVLVREGEVPDHLPDRL
jgi:chaperonin GroES